MLVKNQWYIAAYSHEIKRELFPRTLLGEPVVMFRKLDGSIAAIADRCSHRRAALSRGRLIGDQVQCTYHGLVFDHDGTCASIPGQDVIPTRACIRSYPIVEKDGFVWIWTGEPSLADKENVPDYFMCSSPKCAGKSFVNHVKGDYLLAIENLLDLSHLSYLHPQAFDADISQYRPQTKVENNVVTAIRELHGVPNLPMYEKAMGIDRVDRRQIASFAPGGNLRVDSVIIPMGSQDMSKALIIYIFVAVTPETETTHFAYTGLYRNFAVDNKVLTESMHDEFIEVVMQDVGIIEHQQRNFEKDGYRENAINLVVDQASLEARRIVRALHAKEVADAASKKVAVPATAA